MVVTSVTTVLWAWAIQPGINLVKCEPSKPWAASFSMGGSIESFTEVHINYIHSLSLIYHVGQLVTEDNQHKISGQSKKFTKLRQMGQCSMTPRELEVH